MGVFSEINLFKPANGAFVSGSVVSGIIRYAVDEETVFSKITVSLKGIGRLQLHEKKRSKHSASYTYTHEETYVNFENIIHNKDVNPKPLAIGSYETQFSFMLPQNIPHSLEYYKNTARYQIKCRIRYYIRVKFEKPGFLNFDKKFNKDLTVISTLIPRLSEDPIIFGEQKVLTQWFSSKKSTVTLKGTMEKCIFNLGEIINFNYEVTNDTNIIIKGVKTKVVEKYRFTSHSGHTVLIEDNVDGSDSKTGIISCGSSKNMDIQIPLLSNLNSLDHSNMVSRDYFVVITVYLPIPHRNLVLYIPVQIGAKHYEILNSDESPPSYWEAMGEQEKDNDSF